jgi:hypothetical protein
MSAVQDSTHVSAATLGKSLRSGQSYGLLTPEGTPAREDGRIEAEKARLLVSQSQSEDLGVATRSKPPFENEPDSDSDSEGDNSRVPTQEQKEMTQKVNTLGKGQPRKIIGVAESYSDPREEKERQAYPKVASPAAQYLMNTFSVKLPDSITCLTFSRGLQTAQYIGWRTVHRYCF